MLGSISSKSKNHFNPHLASELAKDSLSEKLQIIIKNIPQGKVTLLEIKNLLGKDGLLLFIALLTIVFFIPVSIPGVSTLFGGSIFLIGISLLLDGHLWLPASFLRKEIPAEKLRHSFKVGLKWLTRLEKISKPHRLIKLTESRTAAIVNGLSVILGSLLLMMPFGFIPFSNTLPALALLFYSIGMLQKDGLSLLLGHFFNLVTLSYFFILISGGTYIINEFLTLF